MASAISISPMVDRAIQEALADAEGGEVIVRSGSHVGRVFLCREAIAWVTCDTVRTRLRDILEEDAGVERESLDAVVDECQHTRQNFGETLIAWGLLDGETLRECMLKHNATHFLGILGLGRHVESIFVPRAKHYSGSLLFGYDELVERCVALREKHSSILPPASEVNERLSRAYVQVPDCRAVMIVDCQERLPVAVWPPARLTLSEEVSLTEVAMRLLDPAVTPLETTRSSWEDPREVFVVGERDLVVIQRCGAAHVVVALCEDCRNLGLTLGMARQALPVISAVDLQLERPSVT